MFITFEGIDGSGKSTQAKLLQKYYAQRGKPCELFHDPGGTITGELIRDILISRDLSPMTRLLLFSASRLMLAEEIEESVGRGALVICDRFIDSTFVYQSGVSQDVIEYIVQKTILRMPDLTILMDIPAEKAIERVFGRGNPNSFDYELLAKGEARRNAYIQRMAIDPHRWIYVPAGDRSESEIHQAIISAVVTKFPNL